jgi:hypothetical protein
MTNESKRAARPRWHRHLAVGLACTAGSWLGEGFLHSLMAGRLGVSGLIWPADPHELWMRALIAALMLAFTAHVVHDVRQLEHLRIEGQRLHRELDVALTHALAGFIPVCSSCKGIRRDDGDWERMESYLATHTEAKFTHGICPDCRERLYPGIPHAPMAEFHVPPSSR